MDAISGGKNIMAKILRQDVKKKGGIVESKVYLDGRRVKWLSLVQTPNGAWQMKYQYVRASGSNIYTENYGTLIKIPIVREGREEFELVEKIANTSTSDWMWERQIKRGLIV